MAWKIYYSDGTTFDHTQDGSPPPYGVICIQSYHEGDESRQRFTAQGGDFYVWDGVDRQFMMLDIMGLMDLGLEKGDILGISPGCPTIFDTPKGPMDQLGLIHYMVEVQKRVLVGRTVPTSVFRSIMKTAAEDTYFPKIEVKLPSFQ